MSNLFIEISAVNATKRYRMYDNIFEESICDNKKDLYKALLKEYGRCTGKMFIDDKNGNPVQIGWVFVPGNIFEDSKEQANETCSVLKEAYLAGKRAKIAEIKKVLEIG